MVRFGTDSSNMREMDKIGIFLSRLKLLIIMCNAYLKEYPLGAYRKEAIKSNADKVSYETVDWGGYYSNFRTENLLINNMGLDHIFYQRIKLLSVMAKAFAEEYPMGHLRKKAIQDNIKNICNVIKLESKFGEFQFLKVA